MNRSSGETSKPIHKQAGVRFASSLDSPSSMIDDIDGIYDFDPDDTPINAISLLVFSEDVVEELEKLIRLEDSFSKIHRFPVSLREFCQEQHYIVPKTVAIGPYYRHLPELQEMEEVKKAATYYLSRYNDFLDQDFVCRKFVAVADIAREFYDANALQGISSDAFASMMLNDACFLLQTILAITDPENCHSYLRHQIGARITVILRDIFLLENQIPWIVLEALMDTDEVDLGMFIANMGMNVQSRLDRKERPLELGDYKPPHLLGLFHFYQTGREFTRAVYNSLPAHSKLCSQNTCSVPIARPCIQKVLESLPLSTSAIELAEIGVKLTPSKTAELKNIDLTEGILFCKLFLPSLHLNENTACWLLNMAAFETCMASDHYTVKSYLALFAMLMDREEDVHELRAKNLIHGEFTDKQVLNFFKGRQLASNIRPGSDFYGILRRLERYRQKKWVWIAIHRFVYNNVKTIFTVLSIVSVLAAIFQTLLSLKKTAHRAVNRASLN